MIEFRALLIAAFALLILLFAEIHARVGMNGLRPQTP